MNRRTPPEPLKNVHQETRALRRDLAEARDEQLLRAVSLVDAMPARGDADALVAPFRQRLRVLRPQRPIGLTRLIFLPIEPLMVAAPTWRRGDQSVPRHVLPPLAILVRTGLGARAAAIDAALKRLSGTNLRGGAAAFGQVGLQVWPEAARILALAAVPNGWRASTGMHDKDFLQIVRLVAALLGMASDRQLLNDQINRDGAADPAHFAKVVAASMEAPAEVAEVAMALLLIGLPRPDLVLQAMDAHARSAGSGAQSLIERAIDVALERTPAAVKAPADLATSMTSLRSGIALLKALPSRAPPNDDRRARMQRVRESVDAACRSHVTSLVGAQIVAPLQAMAAGASDNEVAALERTARSLRELEAVGRQVGRPASYRDHLDTALASVQRSPALTLADRVRLTELLADTGAALALMHQA